LAGKQRGRKSYSATKTKSNHRRQREEEKSRKKKLFVIQVEDGKVEFSPTGIASCTPAPHFRGRQNFSFNFIPKKNNTKMLSELSKSH
jgi:hypothetical protein